MSPAALLDAVGSWAYLLVFALTVAETSAFLGILVPGETLILLAATLAGRGELDPVPLAVAVVGGGAIGDSLGYAFGAWYGHRRGVERLLRRARQDGPFNRAQHYLHDHGATAVFTGRFVGFVRSLLPFAAGASGMPYRRFLTYSLGASLIWGLGNVLAGYLLGERAAALLHDLGIGGSVVIAVGVVALLVLVGVRRRANAGRGT